MNAIEVKDVCFEYRAGEVSLPIFRSFSLEVNQGEFLAIKGPSGSGKSTLLYLLAGLLNIDRGSVKIKGRDLVNLSDLDRSFLRNQTIGFVFQQFHLLPKATVMDNILLPNFYPIEKNGCDKISNEQVVNLAKELGLEGRLNHRPNQLSGGQQQRVAIARALINNPDIILADEPTGNLDSRSTKQIIAILQALHAKGKTVILITHDDEIANIASRVCYLEDGRITQQKNLPPRKSLPDFSQTASVLSGKILSQVSQRDDFSSSVKKSTNLSEQMRISFSMALSNAFRDKKRSFLTMLGVTVGVAAVCSMVTIGNFTKDKVLSSYADLGVNTLVFRGHRNWDMKATDSVSANFESLDWKNDLLPLKKIFKDVQFISPNMTSWQSTVTYAGKSIESKPQVKGVSEEGLEVLNRKVIAGRGISKFHVENRSKVCVVGYGVAKQLFPTILPIGKMIYVERDGETFACLIRGILENRSSNKESENPNFQIFIPFTLFQSLSKYWWSSLIRSTSIKISKSADVERVGQGIKNFFERKYSNSGVFTVDTDSILVSQMKKFLDLFTILLICIALVTLSVGGIGITNTMLVSVSERLKEIGIRKAVGATNSSIRYQFLQEAIVMSTAAGIVGIGLGVAVYQAAIYGASHFIEKLEFEWIFDPLAILLSVVSIIVVGVLSGLVPALKAERLQVIDALRSE